MNLREQGLGCVVDEEERLDCFPFFETCVWSCVVLFKEDFGNIFVGSTLPETLLML
jgi:hypothetical protein